MKNIGLVLEELSSVQIKGWTDYAKHLGMEHLFFSREECFLDEYVLVEKNCRLFYDLKLFIRNCCREQTWPASIVEPAKNLDSPLLLLESDFTCLDRGRRLDKIYRDGYRESGVSYLKKESWQGPCTFYPQAGHSEFFGFSKQRPALFLDRDGVINKDKGYVHKWKDIEFCSGIGELIKGACQKGYFVFVVTNQSGIGRGFYPEEDVIFLHDQMNQYLKERGAEITRWFFCPWHREGKGQYQKISIWRKPQGGMILQAEAEFPIDRLNSFMVGDQPSDRIRLQGLESILVREEDDFKRILSKLR